MIYLLDRHRPRAYPHGGRRRPYCNASKGIQYLANIKAGYSKACQTRTFYITKKAKGTLCMLQYLDLVYLLCLDRHAHSMLTISIRTALFRTLHSD